MKKKTVYVVVQEGGSSLEAYAASYDTLDEAQDIRRKHAEATYRSMGPFPVVVHETLRRAFIEEHDALDLAARIKAAEYSYP